MEGALAGTGAYVARRDDPPIGTKFTLMSFGKLGSAPGRPVRPYYGSA